MCQMDVLKFRIMSTMNNLNPETNPDWFMNVDEQIKTKEYTKYFR